MSTVLTSIWIISATLAAFSIVLMTYLILRRIVVDRIRQSRNQRFERLKKLIFDYLSDDLKLDDFANQVPPKDQRLLLSLSVRFIRGLKSTSRQKLIDLLNETINLKTQLKALRKGSDAERAALCSQLTWVTNADVNQAFWSLLNDRSSDVVLSAANALIDCGQPLNLVDFLQIAETKGMLAHRGIRELVRRVASDQTSELCTLLTHSNNSIVSIAADALGRIRSTQGLKELTEVAEHHSDIDVRASCLRALGLIGHPEAAWPVTMGLEDKAWPVRAQAAIAAGRIGLVDLIPMLSISLGDPEWWVRFRSAEALMQFGDTGLDVLTRARESSDIQKATVAGLAIMEAQP